jgi:hypothetical protein
VASAVTIEVSEEVYVLNVLKNSGRIVASLAVVLALSFASAASAAEGKGKITGKVLDKDGKGAAGVNVRLNKPAEKGDAPKPTAADGDKAEKGKGKGGANLVAKTMSEADGSYTLADVPAGDYVLQARAKDKTAARQKVSVKDGETLTVELKLKEPKAAKK